MTEAADSDSLDWPSEGDEALEDLLNHDENSVSVTIGVHDASHFEWRVIVPMPARGSLRYTIDAEFELPSNSVSSGAPWDQLQGFTRLEGPQTVAAKESGGATVDAFRQRVLALQQMLRRAREGVVRHCRFLSGPQRHPTDDQMGRLLTAWLDAAFRALATLRSQLSESQPGDTAELSRERTLADEFISVRLIDFVAEAQATIDDTVRPLAAADPHFGELLASLDGRLSKTLDAELRDRKLKGYPIAEAKSPQSLELYVERGGRLKKHFEAVLALDRETYQIDERMRVWFTSSAAVLAGACAFAIQFYLLLTSNPTRLSWSLIGLAFLMGGSYAMRERIKEVGRAWLTGRVYRFYAQRVVRCRLPADRAPQREVVLEAKEWCNETTSARPDPLNRESGASLLVTLVNHVHRGVVTAQPVLAQAGVRRIRQLFRYDLSPLFPRLHDPVKRIPVLDPDSGRSQFVDAPRRYQMPIRVAVTADGTKHEVSATLFLDKRGIVRIEQGMQVDPKELIPKR